MLVQFLIENSAEIFGGDIVSLFQRPDKNSTNSERSRGKLVAFYLQGIVKIFLIGEALMQNSLLLLHLCQRKVLKKQLFLCVFFCVFLFFPVRYGQERGKGKQRAEFSQLKYVPEHETSSVADVQHIPVIPD